jgi:hypothetical protein
MLPPSGMEFGHSTTVTATGRALPSRRTLKVTCCLIGTITIARMKARAPSFLPVAPSITYHQCPDQLISCCHY